MLNLSMIELKILLFFRCCAGQYNNGKNFLNICLNNSDYFIKCEWIFFASTVPCVEWVKQEGIFQEENEQYKLKWEKGKVIEKDNKILLWDFEYNLHK